MCVCECMPCVSMCCVSVHHMCGVVCVCVSHVNVYCVSEEATEARTQHWVLAPELESRVLVNYCLTCVLGTDHLVFGKSQQCSGN